MAGSVSSVLIYSQMKLLYETPSLDLLDILLEGNILSDQLPPGGEDDYGEF